MIRISAASGVALALVLPAAIPATRAHAADTSYKSNDARSDTKAGGLSKGEGEEGVKTGAGPMTGSKSDTSPATGSTPATNAPSAPSGH